MASLRSGLVPPLLRVICNLFRFSEGEICVIVKFHQCYAATTAFVEYHLSMFLKIVPAIPNRSLVLAILIAASCTVV